MNSEEKNTRKAAGYDVWDKALQELGAIGLPVDFSVAFWDLWVCIFFGC